MTEATDPDTVVEYAVRYDADLTSYASADRTFAERLAQ